MSRMWNLKHATDEPIYKIETDSQTNKKTYGYQREKGVGWEINEEFGIDRDILLHIKQITNEGPTLIVQRTIFNIS